MAYKPEVFVDGEWCRNGLTFATEKEAIEYAQDLHNRWMLSAGYRAVEVSEDEYPVNYRLVDFNLEPVEVAK